MSFFGFIRMSLKSLESLTLLTIRSGVLSKLIFSSNADSGSRRQTPEGEVEGGYSDSPPPIPSPRRPSRMHEVPTSAEDSAELRVTLSRLPRRAPDKSLRQRGTTPDRGFELIETAHETTSEALQVSILWRRIVGALL
jgi:hypothetical protein